MGSETFVGVAIRCGRLSDYYPTTVCTIDASTATASITQKAMTQKPMRSCIRTSSALLPENAASVNLAAL
jgi:hypothetical protein